MEALSPEKLIKAGEVELSDEDCFLFFDKVMTRVTIFHKIITVTALLFLN